MSQRAKTVQFDGFTWELRLPSNIDTEIDRGAWWDLDVHDWIVQYVKPGMVCVDAGANIGAFTMLMSRCVGPEGRVHAFEPCMGFFVRLQRHIELNHIGNVTANQLALRDKVGPAIIVQDGPPYYSTARVVDGIAGATVAAGFAVQSVALDDYWQGRLDFIKIDVDGCEMELLRGAEGMILECRPIVVIEIPLSAEGAGVAAWLADRDYSLCHKGEISPSDIEPRRVAGTINVLARPKEIK